MNYIRTILTELWHGKSLLRIYLNRRLAREHLSGEVLDVGCGSNVLYLDFIPREKGTHMNVFDQKVGQVMDFERDALPQSTNTFDTVLVLNVLEHVFNYNHLIDEMKRVMKPGGTLIGFTPFLVRYHPDPHDFFRYTDQALAKILAAHTFNDIHIEPIGVGPFMASLNVFLISIPRPLRILCVPCAMLLDAFFLRVRPNARAIYPMGYYFTAKK